MFHKNLEIQANFKVRFLRRNDEMPRIKNFQAKKAEVNVEFRVSFWDMSEKFGNFDGFNRVVTEDHKQDDIQSLPALPYNALCIKLFPYI